MAGERSSTGLYMMIFERALTEPRVKRVARRMSLSQFDVLGRLNHLWMLVYQRRSEFVDFIDADIATGELPGFVDAVILEGLADRMDENSIRISGAEEVLARLRRIDGLSEINAAKGRKSGEARRAMSREIHQRAAVQQRLELGSNVLFSEIRTDLDQNQNSLLPRDSPARAQALANDRPPGATPDLPNVQPGAAGEHVERVRGNRPAPPQATQLAEQLLQAVILNNDTGRLARSSPRLKQQTVLRWANTIRLLNEIDKLEWQEIALMIRWSQADPFWKKTILGADNLRQHWDRMAMQKNQTHQRRNGKPEPRPGPSELARREVEQLERAATSRGKE
jgi:hypothetical protein